MRLGLCIALLVLCWPLHTLRAQTLLGQPQAGFIVMETSLPTADYASFAQARDSASFAPGSAENKGLLDKGFGVPVRVRSVHEGYVVVQAASSRLQVPVPLGWRGFDDGQRTRLFGRAGNVGMVINAMPTEGFETWNETREQVWKHARKTAEERAKKDPRYSARLIRLANGTFGMRETNIYDGEDDPYSSVILFRQHPDDPRMAIRLNLFAPVGDFERYLALAALVMKDLQGLRVLSGLDHDFSKLPK